jgi:hypothetical protein
MEPKLRSRSEDVENGSQAPDRHARSFAFDGAVAAESGPVLGAAHDRVEVRAHVPRQLLGEHGVHRTSRLACREPVGGRLDDRILEVDPRGTRRAGLAVLPETSSRGLPRRLRGGCGPGLPLSEPTRGTRRRTGRAAQHGGACRAQRCRPALAAVGREVGAPFRCRRRASCAAWGEEVEGPPVIAQPDRRAARTCGDVRPVRGCSIA